MQDSDLPTTADAAGDKKHNVYAGIDVFERPAFCAANRHSKWQVNTALEKIKQNDISAAIFAPGWVYEHLGKDQFVTNQNKWWGEVEKSWRIMQKYPKSLPFYSNFDQGRGYHIAVEGRQVSDAPWNNISCQGVQPHLENTTESASDKIEVLVELNEASYNGGGNLTFNGELQNGAFFETRIFQAELVLGDSPVNFTHSVKSEENSQFGLSLKFFSEEYGKESFLLAPLTMTDISSKFTEVITPNQVRKPEMARGWVLMDSTIRKSGWTLTEINAVCYKPTAKTRKQDPDSESSDEDNTSGFLPATSWLLKSETLQNTGSKSLNITWKLKDGEEASFLRYYIYVENSAPKTDGKQESKLEDRVKYLGVAHVQAFYVSEIDIPPGVTSLKFIIQACAADGAFQKLNDSPCIEVNV
ncbi:hypothetical protein SLA2020_504230 [Shorea laevis]